MVHLAYWATTTRMWRRRERRGVDGLILATQHRERLADKEVANKHRIPFVIVHHTRKAGATDFLDEVSCTQGVAGAADTVLVLKRTRGKADAVLQLRQSGKLQVYEYGSGGLESVMVNDLATAKTASTHAYNDAGTHHLEINSECSGQ